MTVYQTKAKKLPGTSYQEVQKHALFIYDQIKKKTKRRPYVRSAYFNKQKVFFDYFWKHSYQKNQRERFRRLKYLSAALEVIEESRNHPITIENRHRQGELLHRFIGSTRDGDLFYVQVKEDRRSGKKIFNVLFSPSIKLLTTKILRL